MSGTEALCLSTTSQSAMAPDRNGSQSSAVPINQRTFTLTSLPGPSSASASGSYSGRAGRRLHVPAEVLRASKIAASDPILVASTLSARDLGKRLSLKDNSQDAKSGQAAKPDQKVSLKGRHALVKHKLASAVDSYFVHTDRCPFTCGIGIRLALLHATKDPYVLLHSYRSALPRNMR